MQLLSMRASPHGPPHMQGLEQGQAAPHTSCIGWHQVPPKAQNPQPAVSSPTEHDTTPNIQKDERLNRGN